MADDRAWRGSGRRGESMVFPTWNTQESAMHTRTRNSFETTLQGVAGQLVERAAALPGDDGRGQLLRWLLAIGALFLAWLMWRGLKSMAWVAFGLGMAMYWTGAWRVLS